MKAFSVGGSQRNGRLEVAVEVTFPSFCFLLFVREAAPTTFGVAPGRTSEREPSARFLLLGLGPSLEEAARRLGVAPAMMFETGLDMMMKGTISVGKKEKVKQNCPLILKRKCEPLSFPNFEKWPGAPTVIDARLDVSGRVRQEEYSDTT